MSKLSNLQLENAVLRQEAAEYDVAIAEAAVVIDDLTAALWAAKRRIAELEAALPKVKPPRPPRVVTQDEIDRLARMAAARAQAIATGKTALA